MIGFFLEPYFQLPKQITIAPIIMPKTSNTNMYAALDASASPIVDTPAPPRVWAKVVGQSDDAIPQQAPASGSKKSKRGEVVQIDIIYTDAPTEKKNTERKPYVPRNEVDPRALEIAKTLVSTHLDACQKCTTRKQFEELYASLYSPPTINCGVVLFALSKGLKMVNVFEQGTKLGWHTSPRKPSTDAPTPRKDTPKKPQVAQPVSAPPPTQEEIDAQIAKLTEQINVRDNLGEYFSRFFKIHKNALADLEEESDDSPAYQELLRFHTSITKSIDARLNSLEKEIDQLTDARSKLASL